DSIGLVKVLGQFNQGLDALEQSIGMKTTFEAGVGFNPNAQDINLEVERFRQKIAAGASFAMSQPIYSLTQWQRFWQAFGGPAPVPVLLGLMPLVSFRQAHYLHNEVPGIDIPGKILQQLEQAEQQGTAQELGIQLALQMVEALYHEVHGVYLVPSYNKIEPLIPLIAAIRQKDSSARIQMDE
ncbi:MAG: methylenetetrahydrofolate reductase, partial [Firmicutes bacterium]|nr:methylenetetrahydrofolate reductase [Bacillota bacterium]